MTDGLRFAISYVVGFMIGTNAIAGGQQVSNMNSLNSGYVKLLKRVLYAPFLASESLNAAYDHENLNGAKVVSYRTLLDSQPLQDSILSCLQPVLNGARGMDDWRENQLQLYDTVIQNSAVYYYNWSHQDTFSNPKRGSVLIPTSNIIEGLDMSMPRQYILQANVASNVALNHYTFASFVREVHSTPLGLEIRIA